MLCCNDNEHKGRRAMNLDDILCALIYAALVLALIFAPALWQV